MAGGNLRCFTKVRCLSEASSNFWKTVLAEFRRPRSQPPTKPQPEPMHTPRRPIHVLYLHPPTIYHKIKTKTQRRNPHVHHRPGIRDVPSPPSPTLRYYDKEGLFPNLKRESGIRKFNDHELEALRMIECLKASGLEIKDIKQFF